MTKQPQPEQQHPAVLFEACPKCGLGDLLVYHHPEGSTIRCVRCAYNGGLVSTYPLKASKTKPAAATIPED
jgi:hypothetical protein